MSAYQPKTGHKCSCRRGAQRDNCPNCEGTGFVIDFAMIRACGKQDAGLRAALSKIGDLLETHPQANSGNSKVHYAMHAARAAIANAKLTP